MNNIFLQPCPTSSCHSWFTMAQQSANHMPSATFWQRKLDSVARTKSRQPRLRWLPSWSEISWPVSISWCQPCWGLQYPLPIYEPFPWGSSWPSLYKALPCHILALLSSVTCFWTLANQNHNPIYWYIPSSFKYSFLWTTVLKFLLIKLFLWIPSVHCPLQREQE